MASRNPASAWGSSMDSYSTIADVMSAMTAREMFSICFHCNTTALLCDVTACGALGEVILGKMTQPRPLEGDPYPSDGTQKSLSPPVFSRGSPSLRSPANMRHMICLTCSNPRHEVTHY